MPRFNVYSYHSFKGDADDWSDFHDVEDLSLEQGSTTGHPDTPIGQNLSPGQRESRLSIRRKLPFHRPNKIRAPFRVILKPDQYTELTKS